jgi:hypothetical protein
MGGNLVGLWKTVKRGVCKASFSLGVESVLQTKSSRFHLVCRAFATEDFPFGFLDRMVGWAYSAALER